MRTENSSEDRLAGLLHQLAQADDLPVPRVVRPELAAIFEHGIPAGGTSLLAADLPKSRRHRMLTTLSAVLTTLTGKVVLGTAIAAAGVGAAHSAGVVDVPGLPDKAPAVESPAVETPASDHAVDGSGGDGASNGADNGSAPDDPGVDGDEVSDRATSGEPQEDGREFGTDIAEDATEGTPADGGIGGTEQSDVPADGTTTADEHQPDELPDGGETADEHIPDTTPSTDAPVDRP
ncbi:MAG TPA: hypothetical protein VFY84_17365 [Jiangellales bacterium]|nr:hypothetical protein [Jiangellales bacterium]